MATINMHQAKTSLSELVSRAEAGEEILIARRNKPIVKLVPIDAPNLSPRQSGALAHLGGRIPPDLFLTPMSEQELRAWEGAYPDDPAL